MMLVQKAALVVCFKSKLGSLSISFTRTVGIMGKEQNQKKEAKKKPAKTMKEKKAAKLEKKRNK